MSSASKNDAVIIVFNEIFDLGDSFTNSEVMNQKLKDRQCYNILWTHT